MEKTTTAPRPPVTTLEVAIDFAFVVAAGLAVAATIALVATAFISVVAR